MLDMNGAGYLFGCIHAFMAQGFKAYFQIQRFKTFSKFKVPKGGLDRQRPR